MKEQDILAVNSLTAQRQSVSSPATSKMMLSWALDAREVDANVKTHLWPGTDANLADWKDERVGWGLILPYRAHLSRRELASADDAPKPIRELRKGRGNAPVFRYRPDAQGLDITHIRNYAARSSVPLSGGKTGIAGDALPYYLLIYATPEEIPWRFQYLLNATNAVGRLDLRGKGLENYVRALIKDWQTTDADISRPVVWAAENNDAITQLMREAVAEKVYESLKGDGDIGDKAQFLAGSKATCQNLISSLEQVQPGLIVTTSHGRTDPWSKLPQMRANLGRMIDVNEQTLYDKELLKSWLPNGAIWYAHACCSAGSDNTSVYQGLVEEKSEVDQLLKAVARLGARVAPLPRALLGARKPLRSFIGHVEPTFNWTLRQPGTPDDLTTPLLNALYQNLYQWKPVGLAFRDFYQRLLGLAEQHESARKRHNAMKKDLTTLLIYTRLAAWDIKSTVILGDPTVALPLPDNQGSHKGH